MGSRGIVGEMMTYLLEHAHQRGELLRKGPCDALARAAHPLVASTLASARSAARGHRGSARLVDIASRLLERKHAEDITVGSTRRWTRRGIEIEVETRRATGRGLDGWTHLEGGGSGGGFVAEEGGDEGVGGTAEEHWQLSVQRVRVHLDESGRLVLDHAGEVGDSEARREALWRGANGRVEAGVLLVHSVEPCDQILLRGLGEVALILEEGDQACAHMRSQRHG